MRLNLRRQYECACFFSLVAGAFQSYKPREFSLKWRKTALRQTKLQMMHGHEHEMTRISSNELEFKIAGFYIDTDAGHLASLVPRRTSIHVDGIFIITYYDCWQWAYDYVHTIYR